MRGGVVTDHLTTEEFVSRLANVQKDGNGWNARCPAHEDRRNSLSVSCGDDGRTLVTCHANCGFGEILSAVGVQPSQLMPPKETKPVTSVGRIVATYDYRDADGALRYQVVRREPKDFRQRQPDGNGGWNWKIKGLQPLPYRLPELVTQREFSVFIVEGEKDADRLAGLGLVATCNSGGAGKWRFTPETLEVFRGREVVILPDDDEPGHNHAEQVAESLKDIASEIRIVSLPGVPPKGDVSDWLNAGGTIEDLMELVASTPLWGEAAEDDDGILDFVDLIEQYPSMRDPVVEGFLRRGETANVISKSKIGKSWLGYGLGFSVAFGLDWLGRFRTNRGRVLLCDNELHRETLSSRMKAVASAMGLRYSDCRGWFDVKALRGESRDIHALGPILRKIPKDKYSLIIVDAFYRLLPDGTSENDNAQMTAVYNAINQYGDATGAAFVLIHHSSKGDQSGKQITDIGSGAGAISRAADSHVVLRPHDEADSVVMEAETRSFKRPDPIGLRWFFPVWQPDENLDPSLLQGRRTSGEERRAECDKTDCDRILALLQDGASTERALRPKTGFGREKQQRLLNLLASQGKVQSREVEYRGKQCEEFFAI